LSARFNASSRRLAASLWGTLMSEKLIFSRDFIHELGFFFGAWSAFDMITDFSIGKFLGLSHDATHLLTAGTVWGKKCRLLVELIKRSDHPKKQELLASLKIIQGQAKRDLFAHSYARSSDKTVTFLNRQEGGGYHAEEFTFTLETFREHVHKFVKAASAFQNAIDVPQSDCAAFWEAALSLNNKSDKSPA
jgi:hypothetical protein